jgi:hypothetical protein
MREEHSTFTWLLEPMLERAGFDQRSDTQHVKNLRRIHLREALTVPPVV